MKYYCYNWALAISGLCGRGRRRGGEVLKLLCTPEKTVCEFDKILSFAEMIDQES